MTKIGKTLPNPVTLSKDQCTAEAHVLRVSAEQRGRGWEAAAIDGGLTDPFKAGPISHGRHGGEGEVMFRPLDVCCNVRINSHKINTLTETGLDVFVTFLALFSNRFFETVLTDRG